MAATAMRSYGVDWSKFQLSTGKWATSNQQFAICQIGGTYGGKLDWQATYKSQVKAVLSRGRRAHAYIWYQVGGSITQAKAVLDWLLPKIGLPAGAIVALDYEAGAAKDVKANTEAILYGMRRIKAAGYTPMYYSYKPYTMTFVDYKRIVKEFGTCLWIAAYPDYKVRTEPVWSIFPSMEGVAIWQFTSTNMAGGLDGNIDLTGITQSGYTKKQIAALPAVHEKKAGDDLQPRVWRPCDYEGVAYPYEDADTYEDVELTKKKKTIKKGVGYRIFELRGRATDLGSQWAETANLNFNFNALPGGEKTEVYAPKAYTLITKDGNKEPRKAGYYQAYGVKNGIIDLGGGQTADAKCFNVLL